MLGTPPELSLISKELPIITKSRYPRQKRHPCDFSMADDHHQQQLAFPSTLPSGSIL
jgi:hypothetical protein